ncbi:MAG: GntR family transcriptional regulator [Blastocatellales bacterium]
MEFVFGQRNFPHPPQAAVNSRNHQAGRRHDAAEQHDHLQHVRPDHAFDPADKGTRVIQLSPEQIDEHLSARLLLETEVVRQAKENLTDDDRKQLKAVARKLESVVNNPQLYAELDLQLHGRIWELSGNQTFQKLLEQITTPLFAMGTITRYAARYAAGDGRRAKSLARPSDHIKLIEAICDGTREEAIAAIQEHVTYNWRMTREKVEELLSGTLGAKSRVPATVDTDPSQL